MAENTPDHGIEGADDFYVGESGGFAYSALSEIEGLYEDLLTAFESIEKREPTYESIVVLQPEERTVLLEFYTVVHAHIERLSAIILFEEIADKDNRDRDPTLDFFRKELSQEIRLNLLFRAGLIDAGLKGEIGRVKSVRNDLVHEQANRMYIDLENKTTSDIDRAYRAVTELDELLNEVAEIDLS